MDLVEALQAAEIEHHPGSSSEEIWICCPFCTDRGETSDTRFRLGVNLRSGRAHCFNCEWRGRGEYTFNQLQKALSTGKIEAAQKLRHRKKHKEKVRLPEDFEPLYPLKHNGDYWHRKAYLYARSRGITEDQIKHKKIGYSMVGDFAYRVVFPVYVHGKLKGLVGRDFTGKQDLAYRNSTGGKALYNVSDRPNKTVCLLEGVCDTLAVERAAKKLDIDANGLLGHDLTDNQLELLEPYRTIILWLDPDHAGLKGLQSIPKKIPKNKIVKVVLPQGFVHSGATDSDPDELEKEIIVKRLLHAKHLTPELQLKLRAWSAFEE